MKIKWWGHSCFEIKNQKTIVTDPHPGTSIGLPKPQPKADLALISHDHYDHNATDTIKTEPTLVKKRGNKKIKGTQITAIETYHDKKNGKRRGKNLIFKFTIKNKTLTHLGDLGHLLEKNKIKKIKETNILFIPIGGNFTINAKEATELIKEIEPNIAIPMHYKIKGLNVPIDNERKFIRQNKEIEKVNNPYQVPKELPEPTKTKILEPSFLKNN